MAHPIASFRFADALPICFSIETPNALGKNIQPSAVSTAIHVIYIVADERINPVRTNLPSRRDVYLYHIRGFTRRDARALPEYL